MVRSTPSNDRNDNQRAELGHQKKSQLIHDAQYMTCQTSETAELGYEIRSRSMTREAESFYLDRETREFIDRWYESCLESWPAPYTEHRVETSYGSTYVIECGDPGARDVVLLHGLGMNSGCCPALADVERLAGMYHLYFVDVIGDAGRSVLLKKQKNGLFYADWMHEVLDGLCLKDVLLAGVSWGGAISLITAYKRPELVSGVVAMVVPSVITGVRIIALMRMLNAGRSYDEKKMLSFLSYMNGGSLDVEKIASLRAFMTGLPQTKFRSSIARIPVLKDRELRSISVPCVCFMGEKDPFYKAAKVKNRFDRLDCDVKVTVVPGKGHLLGHDFTPYIIEGLEGR